MSVTIVKATETCSACPSQWDAWDSEGRYWYLRYRYGHGSARRIAAGPDWPDTWEPGDEPDEVISFDFGHELDGVIELAEFCEKAGIGLDLEDYTPWEEYAARALHKALEEQDE